MKVLVDMNLSPDWRGHLQRAGFEAVHWSHVGSVAASDREICAGARERRAVILTSDLDFGAVVAVEGASGPSVLTLRAKVLYNDSMFASVVACLTQFAEQIEAGCLITLEEDGARARLLPIAREGA